ncbi:2,3-diaminopropionate biosynthesis protein SbnB [Paenibacillus sp. 1011MAR3C5]|uniref:2,3-diaminopropionate biosynthesis protein SbnB n=1 Tax=Paenibacillus sp. 1011MAR3C5 TaxID=1675787 RepID=UPI000E6CFEBE|nr:2,3-diaminopropionate biosynthesis protein SbnB [Paenibacillus sp. 1011MAR3C5]RJE84327.1 2,3-diaminopropionate biosynthesis protein SbnB [Paenibacillus sp. 1011MAR3C5]
MLYLGEKDLRVIGFRWRELLGVIGEASRMIDQGEYAQPLKPYLRYGNSANRIIAMPAYIGGGIHAAGIKWIASFPGNLSAGLPRAHSVTVLNDADTGKPSAILNTAAVSAVRTAAVSSLMLDRWLASRSADNQRLRIGIIGWGPIGRIHYEMCRSLFGEHIDHIYLTDIRGVELEVRLTEDMNDRISVTEHWQTWYPHCNVILTCTASSARYIDTPPAPGTLLLDVSLRDYQLEAIREVRTIVVDDWTEVCRENTDIELLHREAGLQAEDVMTLGDVSCRDALGELADGESVLFCPMGMAAFDVAVADWFVKQGEMLGIGTMLE